MVKRTPSKTPTRPPAPLGPTPTRGTPAARRAKKPARRVSFGRAVVLRSPAAVLHKAAPASLTPAKGGRRAGGEEASPGQVREGVLPHARAARRWLLPGRVHAPSAPFDAPCRRECMRAPVQERRYAKRARMNFSLTPCPPPFPQSTPRSRSATKSPRPPTPLRRPPTPPAAAATASRLAFLRLAAAAARKRARERGGGVAGLVAAVGAAVGAARQALWAG